MATQSATQTQTQTRPVDTKLSQNKPGSRAKETPLTGLEHYPQYLPYWDPDERYPALEDYEHVDPGSRADPSKKNLLKGATRLIEITPKTGSDVSGVQLSTLSPEALDELALFVAERKVVIFRGQDLRNAKPEDMVKLGGHFGRHHIHPSSGHPKDYPWMQVNYRPANKITTDFNNRTSSTIWHSDVSFERQPPGTTFIMTFDTPPSGGDTAYANTVEAYNRLSPAFRSHLDTLYATHSAEEIAKIFLQRQGTLRRDPIISTHPVVRKHPVTGEKALFVNEMFTRSIVGYKKEESDNLLRFLYDHIAKGLDFQIRVKWEPNMVIVWDNRVTAHSAIFDYDKSEGVRLVGRLTPQAEKPLPVA